mmetsp:Transcript_24325/g.52682  ORF Transcript_24325/g.52682 Transcript_24325/m.52682 type:complete len:381 (+) Transcript_24325:2466-3608(+)
MCLRLTPTLCRRSVWHSSTPWTTPSQPPTHPCAPRPHAPTPPPPPDCHCVAQATSPPCVRPPPVPVPRWRRRRRRRPVGRTRPRRQRLPVPLPPPPASPPWHTATWRLAPTSPPLPPWPRHWRCVVPRSGTVPPPPRGSCWSLPPSPPPCPRRRSGPASPRLPLGRGQLPLRLLRRRIRPWRRPALHPPPSPTPPWPPHTPQPSWPGPPLPSLLQRRRGLLVSHPPPHSPLPRSCVPWPTSPPSWPSSPHRPPPPSPQPQTALPPSSPDLRRRVRCVLRLWLGSAPPQLQLSPHPVHGQPVSPLPPPRRPPPPPPPPPWTPVLGSPPLWLRPLQRERDGRRQRPRWQQRRRRLPVSAPPPAPAPWLWPVARPQRRRPQRP